VDCIDMVPAKGRDAVWDAARADAARARFEHCAFRLARERKERAERLSRRALRTKRSDPAAERKRAIIAAAIERARAKRAAGGSGR
jgi:electron transport complex protein RnfB